MSDRTHYPPGDCVAFHTDGTRCRRRAAHMPLCENHLYVWDHDGDSWEAKDSHSQHVRDLAAAWQRGFDREWAKLPERPELEPSDA